MALLGVSPGELTLVAGGPPCQGFSKNVPRRRRVMDDPNNLLIRTYLEYCVALKPRMVLMENVAEMRNGFSSRFSEEILATLDQAGYAVTHATLNAADFGVPQRRRRAFFLASRSGRLTKDMVAPTITRWVFHPGSGRWGHPVDTRTLTIREAARIQGFSDSYEFVGSFVQQAGQLGNAVPPLLIERVATTMREQLGIAFNMGPDPFRDAVALQKRPGAGAGGVAGYGGEFGGGVYVQGEHRPADDAGR